MIKTIKTYECNTIALKVVGGFTTQDMQVFAEAFDAKLKQGHDSVNILMVLDELDAKKTSIQAAWQERVWGTKNLKQMGRVAIVANKRSCDWLKRAILLEAWALMKLNPKADERYFDISDLNEAMVFVAGQ